MGFPTIGLTFAISLVASPWLNHLIEGVAGDIYHDRRVVVAGDDRVVYLIPDVPMRNKVPATALRASNRRQFSRAICWEPQFARLNSGTFLSCRQVLMALFVLVPLSLRDCWGWRSTITGRSICR